MLLRTLHGERDLKLDPVPRAQALFDQSSRVQTWSQASGLDTWSGAVVNRDTAGGLPAVGAAMRLIAETIGMIPLIVYQGDEVNRNRARKSWQWEVFHDQPDPEHSAFDFGQDIAQSIEGDGNAFIWKVKSNVRVEQVLVVDPARVEVKRNDAKQKVFDIWENGEKRRYGTDVIHHIRGWTLQPGADRGVSTIALYRHALGSALGLAEYEGRFFRNDASPGGVISVPGKLSEDGTKRIREWWNERHSGLENAHKPGIFTDGATWQTVGISLEDAQFIQSRDFSVAEVARMFRISSPSMLGSVLKGQPPVGDEFERFLKVDLSPRLRRIEASFARDPDLFKGDLFPEYLADAVLRPDAKTRYESYRLARQGGWLTPNEIRERENLPRVEGGDDIQQTPVGGAPNPGNDQIGANPNA